MRREWNERVFAELVGGCVELLGQLVFGGFGGG
jgi:hypothetical protein